MTDRRRVNGPPGGTAPPVFTASLRKKTASAEQHTRAPDEIRKICESSMKLPPTMNGILNYALYLSSRAFQFSELA